MAERNLSRFTWAAFNLQESASLKLRQLRCSQCHVLPGVRGLILNNITEWWRHVSVSGLHGGSRQTGVLELMCDLQLHRPFLRPSVVDPSLHLAPSRNQASARDRIYRVLHSMHNILPRLHSAVASTKWYINNFLERGVNSLLRTVLARQIRNMTF